MSKFSLQFTTHSDRVKSVDFYKKWILMALHTGDVQVWNYEEKKLVKTIKVSEKPVRCAKFLNNLQIAVGSDEGKIQIFESENFELVHEFAAHTDFIRCLCVHPTLPYLISTSDDNSIKVWDYSNSWRMEQHFQGHKNYVMQVAVNPKDPEMLVSVSLDKTVKLWRLGEEKEISSLEEHENGVNCVEFLGKGCLLTGSDDKTIRVWDLESKTCIQTITAHFNNITALCSFGNYLISGSEDNSVKVWDFSDSCIGLESMDFERGRVWSISRGANGLMAFGTDQGTVVASMNV